MSQRKHRQCPFCKSRKGFRVTVQLGGYQEMEMSFKGKLLNIEREGIDDIEPYAHCLNCQRLIATDNLDLEFV